MKRLLAAALLASRCATQRAARQRLHSRQLRRPEAGGGRWIGASRTACARAVPVVVRAVPVMVRAAVRRRAAAAARPSANFDFYVLALSWSPSLLRHGRTRPLARAMRAGRQSRLRHAWAVAAIPERLSQPLPAAIRILPYSALSGLGDLYPDPGLARHEWRQHGLCSGKSPSGYFADVRTARDAIAVPPR